MTPKRTKDKARGQRIYLLRTQILGMKSQEALAKAIVERKLLESLSRGAVGNWEQGQDIGVDGARALVALASERGHRVTIDWILSGLAPGPEQAPARPDKVYVPLDQFENDGQPPPVSEVRLVGYVGAGQEAHYYALADDELDRVPAPDGMTPATVAVEIRGSSLGALFDRWLVYYDDVRTPVSSDQIGAICVVGLPDDRVLIKKLRRSKVGDGLFDLLSNTEDPITAQPVMWAAKVKSMVPR